MRFARPSRSRHPRIWNTIVTGKVPKKHGILDFARKDAKGVPHLFSSKDRKAHALWTIASKAGMSVGVVNFWNTYPLEKVNGVLVSDHLLAKEIDGRERMTHSVKSRVSGQVIYPADWNERLAKLVMEETTPVADFEDPFADGKPLPRWVLRDELQRRFAEDGALARIAKEIIDDARPDVMMVLLPGVDRISHYLWGVVEPEDSYPPGLRPTPEGRAGGQAALFSYYEYADRLVGALTQGYGPNDMVVVLSDHGFEAGEALLRLSGVHASNKAINGIIFIRGPGVEAGTRIKGMTIADVTPTLLTWLGLPSGTDMDGASATFLGVEPPQRIPTHDVGEIAYVDVEETPSGVEEDIVEQLKMLGYIDEE